MKETWAILLAAGSGTRIADASGGRKKQYLDYGNRPLFWSSAVTFSRIPAIKGLVFVFPPSDVEEMRARVEEFCGLDDLGLPWQVVAGGERRQDSVRNGLSGLPSACDAVLVHDAARPFASAGMIQSVIAAVEEGALGVIPVIPVKDTVKRVSGDVVEETLTRSELRAVQTPQGFDRATLEKSHELALENQWKVTDDASMVERMAKVRTVPGEEDNVKITTPEDLRLISGARPAMPCVGWGYDVHRYGAGRPMVLGGVPIAGGPEVVAHSDGDVLLHALTDAILGCLGKGDIGVHFPDTDARFDGADSAVLLKEVLIMAEQSGLRLLHVDVTVIAQVPKLAPWRDQIIKNLIRLLDLEPGNVNFKATTEEKLGFTGEKRGIKAVAAVTALKN